MEREELVARRLERFTEILHLVFSRDPGIETECIVSFPAFILMAHTFGKERLFRHVREFTLSQHECLD